MKATEFHCDRVEESKQATITVMKKFEWWNFVIG